MSPQYDNEEWINPLKDALRKVKQTWHVAEKRVVIVGHNAGAQMAWRLATRSGASSRPCRSSEGKRHE